MQPNEIAEETNRKIHECLEKVETMRKDMKQVKYGHRFIDAIEYYNWGVKFHTCDDDSFSFHTGEADRLIGFLSSLESDSAPIFKDVFHQ